jgi:hypothetical protein
MQLGRVDGVAAVVARTILDVSDQRFARAAVGQRTGLVEQRADRFHHHDVLTLGVAADVVGLAHAPGFKYTPDRGAVVAHIQPVAHVEAVAIDRQRLASERLGDAPAG